MAKMAELRTEWQNGGQMVEWRPNGGIVEWRPNGGMVEWRNGRMARMAEWSNGKNGGIVEWRNGQMAKSYSNGGNVYLTTILWYTPTTTPTTLNSFIV